MRAGLILLISCVGLAAAAPARAGAFEDCERDATEAQAQGEWARTVFVDSTWGRRKNGAARSLTDCHRAFAAKGYRLVDVELLIENSDVEGFFASYVRAD